MDTTPTSFRLGPLDRANMDRVAAMLGTDRTGALRQLLPIGPLADAYAYQKHAGHTVPREWLTWLESWVSQAMAQTMTTDRDYPIDPACLPLNRPLATIELFVRWAAAVDELRDGPFDGGRKSDDALRLIGRKREWRLKANGLGQYVLVAMGDGTGADGAMEE